MKKFVIYTILILTLFFSVNTDALFNGDITQTLGSTDALAQEPVDCGGYWNVGCHIRVAIEGGIQDIQSSIASQIEAAAYGVINIVLTYVGNTILWAFSWILFVAGMLLNLTLQITVVNMSALVKSIDAINDGWTIFRDLANITFIFILLYIAIATILELGVDTRKTITKVIIAALLINFSLFFTKIIVDGSNILTINFYELIDQTERAESNSPDNSGFNINDLDGGLSSAFMQNLQLTTLYNKDGTADTSALAGETPEDTSESILSRTLTVIPRVVFGSLLMLLAAVIFFAVSVMFVVRFVVIVFLMITAPVAFVATILPQTSGISKKWWKSLTSQAIFAPVYMIMTLITLKIMGSVQNSDVITPITSSNSAGANFIFSTNATGFVMIINFFIMFGVLVGTLIIAKMAGGMGGDWATKVGGKAVFGTVGAGGRFAGRAIGGRIKDSGTLNKMTASNNSIVRGAARLGLGAGERIQSGTYDIRNSVGKASGNLSGAIGGGKIDFGKSVTRKDLDKNTEDKIKRKLKNLETSDTQIEKAEINKNSVEGRERLAIDRVQNRDDVKSYTATIEKEGREIAELKKNIANQESRVKTITNDKQRREAEQALSKERSNLRAKESTLSRAKKSRQDIIDRETTVLKEESKKASARLDELKGVDEKEAKKRVGEKRKDETDEQYNKRVEAAKVKSIGDLRKEQLLEDTQNKSRMFRVLLGQTRRDVLRESSAIRKAMKGKKKVTKDSLADLGIDIDDPTTPTTTPKTSGGTPDGSAEKPETGGSE